MTDRAELDALRRQLDALEAGVGEQLAALRGRLATLEAEEMSRSEPPAFDRPAAAPTDDDRPVGAAPATGVEARPRRKPMPDYVGNAVAVAVGFALSRLGPVADLLRQVVAAYRHYRGQGKGTAFALTAFGAVALITGFGYLLQQTFFVLLNDLARVSTGAVVATLVLAVGVEIRRRQPRYADYASALVAISIVLFYLIVFFAGPHYDLVGEVATFALFAGVTGVGLAVALLFVIRVVAVLTLAGGALAPFVLAYVLHDGGWASREEFAVTHGSLQVLLALAAVWLSRRLGGDRLAIFSFGLSTLVVEAYVYLGDTGVGLGVVAELLFLIYGAHGVLRARGPGRPDGAAQLLVANLMMSAAALMLCLNDPVVLGWVALGNAGAAGACFFLARRDRLVCSDGGTQGLLALYAAAFVGLAIYSSVGGEWRNLLWGGEAVLLVWAGAICQLRAMRYEGYAGVWLVVGWTFVDFLDVGPANVGDELPLLLLASGGALIATAWLMHRFRDITMVPAAETGVVGQTGERGETERSGSQAWMCDRARRSLNEGRLFTLFSNGAFCWFSVATLAAGYIVAPDYYLCLAIVPMAVHIYRSTALGSSFLYWFGQAHWAILVGGLLAGAVAAGAVSFHRLDWPARIVVLEIGALTWALEWYYARAVVVMLGERRRRLWPRLMAARALRLLLYVLVPVVTLPTWTRLTGDEPGLGIWGSCVIAHGLALLVGTGRRAVIRAGGLRVHGEALVANEARLFVVVAASLGIAAAFLSEDLLILGVGLVVLAGLSLLTGAERWRQESAALYRSDVVCLLHYLGATMFLVVYEVSGEEAWAFAGVVLWYTVLLRLAPRVRRVRWVIRSAFVMVWLAAACGLAMSNVGLSALVTAPMIVVCLFFLTYRAGRYQRFYRKLLGPPAVKYGLLHAAVVVAYMVVAKVTGFGALGAWVTVALVVHATIVLFSSQSTGLGGTLRIAVGIYGLAVVKILFADIAGFSTLEKTLAFMAIGVILLGAAYGFQRLRDSTSAEVDPELPDKAAP